MNVPDEIFLAGVLRHFEAGGDSLRYDAKCRPKEWCMEFREFDFTRNHVVQNEVFFLQSKCTACGSSILVRLVEELIEHEKLHRTRCSPSDSVA